MKLFVYFCNYKFALPFYKTAKLVVVNYLIIFSHFIGIYNVKLKNLSLNNE